MYQPAPDEDYFKLSIYVHGQKLQIVEKFMYFSNTITITNTLDDWNLHPNQEGQ